MQCVLDFDVSKAVDQVTGIKIQCKCIDLLYFLSKSKSKFINLVHTWQESKIICLS